IPGHLFRMDDDLGWSVRPDRTTRHRTRYFDITYATNSLGFRDKPRVSQTPGVAHRIVLYGDSSVFGWGVAQGERFSDIVERETPTVEVWNHAVPGYGLDQEIILYEKERRALPVNEIMFFVDRFTLSRIRTNFIYAKYKPMFVQEPGGRLELIRPPRLKSLAISVLYEVLSPLYFPHLVQTAVANLQTGLGRGDTTETPPKGIEQRRDIGALETALLNRAVQMAREAHHRISILAANLSEADRGALRE